MGEYTPNYCAFHIFAIMMSYTGRYIYIYIIEEYKGPMIINQSRKADYLKNALLLFTKHISNKIQTKI